MSFHKGVRDVPGTAALQRSKLLNFSLRTRLHPLSGPWLMATFLMDLVEGLLEKLDLLVLGFLSKRT